MLSYAETFVGCSPINKAMVSTGCSVYFIANSSVICAVKGKVVSVIFLKSLGRCIARAGKFIAVGDNQGNGYLIEDKKIIKNFNIEKAVQSCSVSPEGVVAFATINSVHVFYEETVKILKVEDLISTIEICGGILAVGSTTGRLTLYDTSEFDAQCIYTTMAHEEGVSDIKFRNSEVFATASRDSTVKLWEYKEEVLNFQTLDSHTDWVHALHWNNKQLFSASADKTIRLWSQNLDSKFYTFSQIFGGASEFLSVTTENNEIEIEGSTSDTNNISELNNDTKVTNRELQGIGKTKNEYHILGHCKTGGIDCYFINDPTPLYFLSGHLLEVMDVDWKDDILLTCGMDSTARMFYKGKERIRAQIHGYPLSSIAFLPGERFRYVSAAQETILRIYEATQMFFWNCFREEPENPYLMDASEDYVPTAILGELNLTNENMKEYSKDQLSENILSTNVFSESKKIYGHYFELKYVTANETMILSCNKSSSKKYAGLFVWSTDGRRLQYLTDHDLGIQHISTTDSYVLTVSRDKTAYLYKILDGKLDLVKRFADHARGLSCGAISHDNSVFATCARDGQVILYDTSKMDVLVKQIFEEEPTAVCFSPKEKNLIAIGFGSGIVTVFDYTFNILFSDKVLNGRVNAIAFNKSGDRIAIGGSDSLLRILKKI